MKVAQFVAVVRHVVRRCNACTVTAAAIAHEPHRIAFYAHELAAAFHGFWAKGKDDPHLRFVNEDDPKLTLARLALVDAVRQVILNALAILGVSAPEELS